MTYVKLLNQAQLPMVKWISEKERWYVGQIKDRRVSPRDRDVVDRVCNVILKIESGLREWANLAIEEIARNEAWHAGTRRGHAVSCHDPSVLGKTYEILQSHPEELRDWAQSYLHQKYQ